MIRVVAGGEELAAFPDTPHTDRYVKILFPRPGVRYPEPFDMDAIRSELPRDQWPAMRTYTVRALDHAAGELTIDFVHHGDVGLAGPWAAAARPGDVLRLAGPGGAYAPDPDADWHLMVGDESALPAIAAACERVPAGVRVVAMLEVADAAEEQELGCTGVLHTTWLHRRPGAPEQLLDAVRSLEFPPGRVHAFVHGEAGIVRGVRRHLVDERAVPRELLSVSGYWRRGVDEDGWQAEKAADRAAAGGR
ncbi:siderophore-interacting protein [Pseudonocardia hierapolitana]